jgi:hypothetical protein
VENFVDNLSARAFDCSTGEPSGSGARKNGMKNSFLFNELQPRSAARRRTTVGAPRIGAAVELSRGAGHCFADG